MPDTGAPWNIPYVESTDLVSDWPSDSLALANAIADGLDDAGNAFDSVDLITVTNASWPVPTLGSPIVKVTVIGGGGGGGGCEPSPGPTDGAVGGTSSWTTSLGTLTALGGYKGIRNASQVGQAGRGGFCSGNGGGGGRTVSDHAAENGGGGEIKVAYYNMTGISTANVVVGAGGAGGTGFSAGGAGGAGVVIFEYKAP